MSQGFFLRFNEPPRGIRPQDSRGPRLVHIPLTCVESCAPGVSTLEPGRYADSVLFKTLTLAMALSMGVAPLLAEPLWSAPRAHAASAAAAWNGLYVFVGGDAERRRVVAAIDEVVSSLNVVSRNLARARLLEASTPYAALNLEVSANEISVALDDHQVVSPRSGGAVRTSTPTGVRAAVRQQLFGRSLIQVLHTRSGTRQNRFQLSADGARLAVEVRIAAERLPHELEYTLSYRRAD